MMKSFLVALIAIAAVNGDPQGDFVTQLGSLGVKIPAAGLKKIIDCTTPIIYTGSACNASAVADKFKSCAISYCAGQLTVCAPLLSALSNCDKCLKPANEKTMDLISKLIPLIVPKINPDYNQFCKIVQTNKASGKAQAAALPPAFTYANGVVTKNYVDTICQSLLPKMTALEQTCAYNNLKALIDLTSYACGQKASKAGKK